MRLFPLIQPYFEHLPYNKRKAEKIDVDYPIPYPQGIPRTFRKFCCFVGVKTPRRGVLMGAGTLVFTTGIVGILTAAHLLEEVTEGIDVSFFLPSNEWYEIIIPTSYIVIKNDELDIALLRTPALPPFYQPVEIGWENYSVISTDLYAFGCPAGIFGYVWKPKLLTIAGGIIYTKGLACPGVSGGGIFTKVGNKFYLWGVHMAIHLGSYTLLSRTVKLELKEDS